MTEEEIKKDFVENELSALLRKVADGISARYSKCEDGEEIVELINRDGRAYRAVCVTADSLCAIARDVLRCCI